MLTRAEFLKAINRSKMLTTREKAVVVELVQIMIPIDETPARPVELTSDLARIEE